MTQGYRDLKMGFTVFCQRFSVLWCQSWFNHESVGKYYGFESGKIKNSRSPLPQEVRNLVRW